MAAKGKSEVDLNIKSNIDTVLAKLAQLEASLERIDRKNKSSKPIYEPKYGPHVPTSIRNPETGRFQRNPEYQPSWAAYRKQFRDPDVRVDTRTSYQKAEEFYAAKRREQPRRGSAWEKFEKAQWQPPGAVDKAKSGGITTPGSPAYNAFNYRVKKEQYDFYHRENITARVAGGAAKGLYSFATGGGLSGLVSPIVRELQGRSGSGGGGFLGNAITSAALMRGGGRRGGGGGGAAAAEEGAEGASAAEGVAGNALGAGLWAAMPLPVKIVSVAATAVGATAFALDKMSRDVTGRARTAGGVGASLGGFEAFDKTAQRLVDPKNFMGMMAEAKFDLTSDSYRAMLSLGIDPKKYKTTDEMAIAALPKVQNFLQGFKGKEGTMLPMAQAFGLGGMGSEDMIRLFGGEPADMKKLMGTAAEQKDTLDLTKDQITAYQDLVTNIDLASTALKTWAERMASGALPGYDTIQEMLKRQEGLITVDTTQPKTQPNFGGGGPLIQTRPGDKPFSFPVPDWMKPSDITPDMQVPEYTGPGATLHSPHNNPPLESEIQGSGAVDEGGGKVLGGVTRVSIFSPKIAKLNKDVIDTTKSLAEFNEQLLRGSRIMVGGSGQYLASNFGQGAAPGGGGGGGGGLESGAAPRYSSGGIGDTAMPRTLGEGTIGKGSGISSSGLDGGKYTGGTESNTINTNAPEISQLPGDKIWGDYGTRANNPGNLNYASWEGAASKYSYRDPQTGGMHTMGVFKTMPEGVAAAYKLLIRNQAKNGKTLQGALKGWAENGYIGPLAKSLGVDPNDTYDLSTADPEKVASMLEQQFKREGRKGSHTATHEQILAGINLGRGKGTGEVGSTGTGDGKATGGAPEANFGVKDSDDVLDHLKSARDKGLITNEQCVSLATASVGIKLGSGQKGAWTSTWRKGESAAEGGLVKGTPIATFAGLHGEQNQNIYAGGTGGRPKVGLDHAAVFESYIKDRNGKIIGMNVADQWAGSKGVHNQHPYYFGGGYGEHDAGNYSAIDVAGGGHLGGENNPLTQRDAARESSTRSASKLPPHIGDLSQYHTNQSVKLNINNPAGADVATQTAMLGSAQGSFG